MDPKIHGSKDPWIHGSCHLRLFLSSTNYFEIVRQGQESQGETSIIQCLPRPCKSFAALQRSSGFFSVAMFSQTFIKGTRKESPAIEAFALIKLWVTSATKITDFFGSKKGYKWTGVTLLTIVVQPFSWYDIPLFFNQSCNSPMNDLKAAALWLIDLCWKATLQLHIRPWSLVVH